MTHVQRRRVEDRPVLDGSGTGLTIGEMVRDHHDRIDELESWRDQVRGMVSLAKLALGTSVLASIASIVAIAAALTNHP